MSSFQWGKFSEKAIYSILASTAFLNLWEGAVSSGKTVSSIFRFAEKMKRGSPGPALISGKSSHTIKHNVLNLMQDMFPDDIKFNSEEGKFFNREFHIVGAYDERSEQKIRGSSYVYSYADEWTLYPKSYTDMLISRLRMDGAQGFFTTNPDSPYHYIKTDYIDRQNDIDIKVFSFKLEDNLNLDPAYIKRIKAIYSGLFYQRFIEGKWVLADGLVYSMFDPAIHVIDESALPDKDNIKYFAISGDFGTQNPTAFLKWLVTKDNTCYIIDEYYYEGRKEEKQKTPEDYTQDLIKFMGDKTYEGLYFDPSAAPLLAAIRKAHLGYLIKEVNNEVLEGIGTVSTMLSQGKIKVLSKCTNYIKEKATYMWDKKASMKSGEDKVIKLYDHLQDAERYFIHSKFKSRAGHGSWAM